MKWTATLILLLCVSNCTPNYAGPVHAIPPEKGSQLIELFTSQGCSSCPPAEAWIGQLTSHKDLWKRFVPVVFHVDYWDRLGWKDPYAREQYTRRQYEYRNFHQLRSVYTPGFFVDGKEWKGFFEAGNLPAIRTETSKLAATWDAGTITINTTPVVTQTQFHAVVLGFGLKTSVKRGENAGRKLAGNFVVLSHKTSRASLIETPSAEIKFRLSDLASKAPRYGFAVWSTVGASPIPLGASGNWLPKQPFVPERPSRNQR